MSDDRLVSAVRAALDEVKASANFAERWDSNVEMPPASVLRLCDAADEALDYFEPIAFTPPGAAAIRFWASAFGVSTEGATE